MLYPWCHVPLSGVQGPLPMSFCALLCSYQLGTAFFVICTGHSSNSSSAVSSDVYTRFPSHIGCTNLSNSTASPYTSQCHCSLQPGQNQLPRWSQGTTCLWGWCKAGKQSPPGHAAAETQGMMEPAEQPLTCIRPSTSHTQNARGKSKG